MASKTRREWKGSYRTVKLEEQIEDSEKKYEWEK
jgi:hypothetical protein